MALKDPDVQKTLKLTEGELEHLKTLSEEAQREIQEKIQKARQGGAGGPHQIPAWRRQAVDKAVAVLGAERLQLWKGLIGEPFDLPPGGPGRGNTGRPPTAGRQFNLDFDEGI
jgi:hypothetical protein